MIGGLAVGAVSVLSPMYVAEVAPPKIRGTLITIYQLAITMGILISYLVNFALHDVENNWRWMFATGLLPSLLFFIGLFFIPESPRWLVKAGFREKAVKVLERIGGTAILQRMKYLKSKRVWRIQVAIPDSGTCLPENTER